MKKQKQEIRDILCPLPVKKNPFRKSEGETREDSQAEKNSESGKGLAFIDAWKKPAEKPTVPEFSLKHPHSKKAATKKSADKESTSSAKKGKNGRVRKEFSEVPPASIK